MKYCCEIMKGEIERRCSQHPDIFACPDNLIVHYEDRNTYGIIIHDGGPSFIRIKFCPWCGRELSENFDIPQNEKEEL